MHGTLLSRNMPWFVEFFTELLLQIGLVPIQETDADILKNVSDKEKLQKLHSRFTAKVGVVSTSKQRNMSSQRLILDNGETLGNESGGGSGVGNEHSTPDQYFTGHQEFFYRFIRFVDSYVFSIQLQNRLFLLLSKMWSSNDSKGLEQRIMQLQMLSKFLGVLTFSPFWTTDNFTAGSILPDSKPLGQMIEFVDRGWNEGKLVVTIPWVLDFCRMMKWDKSSTQKVQYHVLLGILRSIQQWVVGQVLDGCNQKSCNFLILALHLESFFADMLGMVDVECLPKIHLSPRTYNIADNDGLDELNVDFSASFVNSSSSHLDGLQNLLSDLSRRGENMHTGSTFKKLKPYSLSSYPSRESLNLKDDNQGEHSFLFRTSSPTYNHFNFENNNANTVITRMIDSFYHQHKELQPICNFVIDLGLKNATKKINIESSREVRTSYLRHCNNNCNGSCNNNNSSKLSEPVDIDWYLQILRNVEIDTFDSLRLTNDDIIASYIADSLNVLLHPFVTDQVRKIAVALTIKFACQKGESIVMSSIRVQVKKNIEEHVRKGHQVGTTLDSNRRENLNKSNMNTKLSNSIKILHSIIDTAAATNTSPKPGLTDGEIKHLKEITTEIRKGSSKGNSIGKDDDIVSLSSKLVAYFQNLRISSSNTEDTSDNLFSSSGFVESVDLFCAVSDLGLCPRQIKSFGMLCCDDSILTIILKCSNCFDSFVKIVPKALISNVINQNRLEMAIKNKLAISVLTQREAQQLFVLLSITKKSKLQM